MKKEKIIHCLDKLKKENPEQIIIIETSQGCVECKIGDAIIYEGIAGEIVIDSEKEIPKGTKMVMQRAVVQDLGWCSCYLCLPCIENWLEESGQVDVNDELN